MRPEDCTDALLWSKTLDALRLGIVARQPDAIDRIRLLIRKYEAELGPIVSSIAIQEARLRTGQPVDAERNAALRSRGELIQARLQDLRALLRGVKAAPRAEDAGPTAEALARPQHGPDVPEDLAAAAMDLRCGWMVRTAGLAAAISSYDEMRLHGEPGHVAERLERAYTAWHAEMVRQRMLIWPVTLIVFEGRSALEAARMRGADPRLITHLVAAGLILYQVHAAS